MNIFVLDYDPKLAAQYHMDVHVVKMIIESGQLLSTACHLIGIDKSEIPYKKTHAHHPCTKWVLESSANFDWLFKLLFYLHKEYTYRYGKIHKSARWLSQFLRLQTLMREMLPKTGGLTPFAQAMPDFCKAKDPVNAYRNLYFNVKSRMKRAGWRKTRKMPRWYSTYAAWNPVLAGRYLSTDSYIWEQVGTRVRAKRSLRNFPLMDGIGKILEMTTSG